MAVRGLCTFTTTPPQSNDCVRGKPDGAILTEDYWWVTVLKYDTRLV